MEHFLCDGARDRNACLLHQKEDCRIYQINTESGELSVAEHQVFPGIWLCYKDAHTFQYVYPSSYPAQVLEITHCQEGRFEYNAGDHFFYLAEGDLSISESEGDPASVCCPTGHYHGISVVIDPTLAPDCLSCFLNDVNVRPRALAEKFCEQGRYFLIRSTERLDHIFAELYAIRSQPVEEEIRRGYYKVKILELLLFLSALDPNLSQEEQRICSKAQVDLAKQVCAYVGKNMDTRLTIEQLAAKFYTSPARLKKCFYSVYGQSVQTYIRTCKMKAAAYRLTTSDLTIQEIAGQVGYDNVSKFSKAFRTILGVSPTEYRKAEGKQEPVGAWKKLFGVEHADTFGYNPSWNDR